jgi:hypothetical protein
MPPLNLLSWIIVHIFVAVITVNEFNVTVPLSERTKEEGGVGIEQSV